MNKIEFGDCREIMRRWVADGVKAQTCVTSPPYFGLRDYGHADQIGLEQTPEEYIKAMVEVFRCVRDVLADNGTLWLNIGDSYVGAMSQHKESGSFGENSCISKKTQGGIPQTGRIERNRLLRKNGLKQKDLIGIPWMLAFALRADGWYLRQDIIWNKPNPMPESVTDRCTKAHEYIFLLSKSQKYFYDFEAVKEPSSDNTVSAARRNRADFSTIGTKAIQGTTFGQSGRGANADCKGETRNRRSVWTVATRPYKGAHFATFPPALIEPCILAGSRLGDVVLDPFMGSGTTAYVAASRQRKYLGCELNENYRGLQEKRLESLGGLFLLGEDDA
jgi:DNA modification methylase